MSKLYWLEVHLCGLKLALNQSLQQGLLQDKSYDFVVQFEWIMLIHLIFDRFVIMAVTWLLNQLVEQKSIKFVFMSVTCLLPVVWLFWKISSKIEFLSPFVSTFQLFQVKRKIYLNSNNTSQRYCCTIFSLRKSFSSLSLKIFTC